MGMPAGLARYWKTHRRGGKSKSKRRNTKVAKRTASRKMTIPMGVVAGFFPGVMRAVQDGSSYGWKQGFQSFTYMYTGWNGATNKFDITGLRYGLLPVAAGFMVHKVASMLGVNRALSRARVPFIRI